MRLTTIRTAAGTAAGRVDGTSVTMLPSRDVAEVLASGPDWQTRVAAIDGESWAVADADLAPLVPRPEKIFGIGLNYGAHAAEANVDLPGHPVVFAKYWRSLIGPNDTLVLPSNSAMVDWEAELGIVIGEPLRYGGHEPARAAIAGYSVVNDISMRDWQRRTSQFLQGKTFEGSTPLGPVLVTPDEVDDARRLRITCAVDGVVMQDSYTDDLVFSPVEIVSYLSQIITLVPGDIIMTGTPGGVGAGRRPPVYLQDGQTLTTGIEGLGTQTNVCLKAGNQCASL
jgi:acylpyruvate hydrolase